MILTIVLFVVGFVILTFGANWLVEGASTIAKRFNVSDLVIGLTVVAFGTSAPELVVNVVSSIEGDAEIAIGNVVGSNIFNILFILGVSAIIFPLTVRSNTIWKEIPLSLLSALVLLFVSNDIFLDNRGPNEIGFIDGLVLLSFFVIFLYYMLDLAKKDSKNESISDQKNTPIWKPLLFIGSGLTGLILGARWIVNGAVEIAGLAGISESVIALTIVAAGTSLPELATSVVAAYRRNVDIAIGNIVGSNIFNIFLILGISSLIKPLPLSVNSNFDIGMVVFASLLLLLFIFTGKGRQISRMEGGIFIICYCAYLYYLIFPFI